MIKLISSDMDGTLLDSYRQITPINVEAIKRAQENGINFIINTGREYPNARGLVEAAGLKCDLICSVLVSGSLFKHLICYIVMIHLIRKLVLCVNLRCIYLCNHILLLQLPIFNH